MTMTSELISARTFLQKHFPTGGKVLCAVSGGLDSMCLLDLLCRQRDFSVTAAHFNHQLRGEAADRDEAFVRGWCAARGIPLAVGRGDTRGLAQREGRTIEEAARMLRYAFLEETAKSGGFDAIFTAHHADDNAETMLLNLIRGTGSAGLAGIPQIRGRIYRPLLRIGREQLVGYAAAHGVPHVEDETNELDDAARNILRHKVLPVLRQLNGRAVENMSAAAGILSRENEGMERLAAGLLERAAAEEDVSVSCRVLLDVPPALAERTVMQMLAAAAGRRKDFTAVHVEAVLDLAERGAGEVRLPYGLTARRLGDTLSISRREILEQTELCPDTPLRWGDCILTLMDRREGGGLALRDRREWESGTVTVAPVAPGDRLTLPGARGGRSVKRLCLERHIPLEERDRLPAIYADGRLAAVWRLGVDTEFLPEGETCRFIQIKQTEENDHEK